VLPLTTPIEGSGKFLVRLAFAAPPGDKAGQRVFDIRLNGKTVEKNFDIFAAAGAADRAVWKEYPIEVADNLIVDFVARGETPSREALPLLNGLEVLRQEMTTLGYDAPPDAWLNAQQRETTLRVKLTNWTDAEFRGRLAVKAPAGLQAVNSGGEELSLAPQTRREVDLKIAATGDLAAGRHMLAIEVFAHDGKSALQRELPIDYLDQLERRVLTGGSACLLPEEFAARLHKCVQPNMANQRLHVAAGANVPGDTGAAASYVWFSVPDDVRERVRAARVRLHLSDRQMHVAQLSPSKQTEDGATPPLDLGIVQQLEGPNWPNFGALKYADRPKPRDANVRLAYLPGSSRVVEATVPGSLDHVKATPQVYLAISPSSPTAGQGVIYVGHQATMIIDYEPPPK
jgi:hypothetical protein